MIDQSQRDMQIMWEHIFLWDFNFLFVIVHVFVELANKGTQRWSPTLL